jgi:cytochrome P450
LISIRLTSPIRFAFYEWARAEAPVFFSEELAYYVVPGHADIKAVFEDWRTLLFGKCPGAAASHVRGGQADHAGGRLHRLFRAVRPRAARSHPHPQAGAGLLSAPRRFKSIEPQIRQIVTHAIDAIIGNGPRPSSSASSPTMFRLRAVQAGRRAGR